MKVRIAAVKAPDYRDAEKAVFRAVDLLGGLSFLKPGWKVLIKPNLLFGISPEKCVTTHPAIVEAALKMVKEAGCHPVLGDSPIIGRGGFHYNKAGYKEICRKLDVPWANFEDDAVEVEGGRTFKKLLVARAALEADAIINLPKIKTHGQTLLTLSVKNMFGIVPGVRKAQWHLTAGRDVKQFCRMLVEICYLKKPALNIADGILALDGNGPRAGSPYKLGYIFAGEDPSAVDRVICQALGVKPEIVPTLAAAAELGLGETRLENIEIIGDDPFSAHTGDFLLPGRQSPTDTYSRIPFLKDSVTSRPKIDRRKCSICEQCLEHCPAAAMSLAPKGKNETGELDVDLKLCIRCYCCSEICPEGAVSVEEGWLWKLLPGFLK